mmetsp:Transcript_299/g.489  ORF Transcript_299/g.489 Transcript_299/m.489 type:complete len:164 (+) Transcript_299:236-727(+)
MKVTTSISLGSACLLLAGFPSNVVSFSVRSTAFVTSKITTTTTLFSQPPEEEEPPQLFLDNLGDQMAEVSSKYPTSESAYLEASRKRAEAYRQGQLQSQNSGASDAEWQKMAETKSAGGDVQDDWEAALEDEGNESQILMFNEDNEGEEGEGGEDDEPKLLLF